MSAKSLAPLTVGSPALQELGNERLSLHLPVLLFCTRIKFTISRDLLLLGMHTCHIAKFTLSGELLDIHHAQQV